jgi:hypothetical protein
MIMADRISGSVIKEYGRKAVAYVRVILAPAAVFC